MGPGACVQIAQVGCDDMAALLEVEDLAVEFHRDGTVSRAVNRVTLSVERGKSLGIVGESGSGKSVTVKAIMRLLPRYTQIQSGAIRLDGQDVMTLNEGRMRRLRGRRMAMVFQDPHAYLNPTKTVGSQLVEPLILHRLATGAEAKRRAVDLLRQVGIPSPEVRFAQYPFEFSGGMLQRVMIAMALIADPELLIADEPTTALDVTVQAQILRLLRKLKDDRGMSLILVTHDLVVAAQTCDEVVVMYGGTVVERVPSHKLLMASAHPYARGLIACTPRISNATAIPTPIPGQPLNLRKPLPAGCLFAERCPDRIEQCTAARPLLEDIAADHQVACFVATAAAKEGAAQ